jgi:hypothetical protein
MKKITLALFVLFLATPVAAKVVINGEEYTPDADGNVSVQITNEGTTVTNSTYVEASSDGGDAYAEVHVSNKVNGGKEPDQQIDIVVTPEDGPVNIHKESSNKDGTVHNTVRVHMNEDTEITENEAVSDETTKTLDTPDDTEIKADTTTEIKVSFWQKFISFFNNFFNWA